MATFEVPRPPELINEGLLAEQALSFKETLKNDILKNARMKLEREQEVVERFASYVEKHHLEDFFKELEEHDLQTARHSIRVAMIGLDMGLQENFLEEKLEAIAVGMSVHDIGKLDVPKELLAKSGEFTPKEWEVIYNHPLFGLIRLRTDPRFASVAALWGTQEATEFHHGHKKTRGTKKGPVHAYPVDLADLPNGPKEFMGIKVKDMDEEMKRFLAVCSAADSYDALTDLSRTYHAPVTSAEEIVTEMKIDQNLPEDLMRKAASRFPKEMEVPMVQAAAA